jgi:hypothetical protein
MDSAVVNKSIRSLVWPTLKAAGFAKFTARNAWRFHPDRVDIVNFQSFNSYLAEAVGCTTYSFSVNLSCLLLYVPEVGAGRIKSWQGHLIPAEYACDFRGRLFRTFDQPELARREIWYIDAKGISLEKFLCDVQELFDIRGSAWFGRFADQQSVLDLLLETEEEDELWGFGAPGSPHRCYLAGYVARPSGKPTWRGSTCCELRLPSRMQVWRIGCVAMRPNPRLQRTPSAAPPSPLSRKPLGDVNTDDLF